MLSNGFGANPQARGYHVAYREEEVNHCPGCGRTHWFIGRLSAECAFCATALPLAEASTQASGSFILRPSRLSQQHALAA